MPGKLIPPPRILHCRLKSDSVHQAALQETNPSHLDQFLDPPQANETHQKRKFQRQNPEIIPGAAPGACHTDLRLKFIRWRKFKMKAKFPAQCFGGFDYVATALKTLRTRNVLSPRDKVKLRRTFAAEDTDE